MLNSHAYGYNLASQRTALTNTAGNYVSYTYDLTGELKTALGKESSGSSRLNEQFGYAYDVAGNLNARTNNALIQVFGVNSLNELNTVTRSGTLTVAGGTSSAATNVIVNGSAASRYNDNTFALAGFTVTNGNNTFSAMAQDAYGRKDTNSVIFNLPSSVSFVYDSNGNLTSDGTRGFDYDDENQLIRVTVTNSWKSEFTYDGKMRRRIRKEFIWQNSTWAQTAEVHYIYDGMLVIQERDSSNLPSVTYTRGQDLSGALQGAGGIGGLLARTDAANGQSACYHADGNGNLTAMVNAQQVIAAKYIYDPFGNTLSKSGPLANANTYRFSSQEYHQNSGLALYLYRVYDPNLQRWLNRDPLGDHQAILVLQSAPQSMVRFLRGRKIEQLEGPSLFAYVANNPMSFVDPFGREHVQEPGFTKPITPGNVGPNMWKDLSLALPKPEGLWLFAGGQGKLPKGGQVECFSFGGYNKKLGWNVGGINGFATDPRVLNASFGTEWTYSQNYGWQLVPVPALIDVNFKVFGVGSIIGTNGSVASGFLYFELPGPGGTGGMWGLGIDF